MKSANILLITPEKKLAITAEKDANERIDTSQYEPIILPKYVQKLQNFEL